MRAVIVSCFRRDALGALLGYGLAYLLFLTLLDLGAAFHHTFEFHRLAWDEPVPTQAYTC